MRLSPLIRTGLSQATLSTALWFTYALAADITPNMLESKLKGAGEPIRQAYKNVGCSVFGVFINSGNIRFLFGFLFTIMLCTLGWQILKSQRGSSFDVMRLFAFIAAYMIGMAIIYLVFSKVFHCI